MYRKGMVKKSFLQGRKQNKLFEKLFYVFNMRFYRYVNSVIS